MPLFSPQNNFWLILGLVYEFHVCLTACFSLPIKHLLSDSSHILSVRRSTVKITL